MQLCCCQVCAALEAQTCTQERYWAQPQLRSRKTKKLFTHCATSCPQGLAHRGHIDYIGDPHWEQSHLPLHSQTSVQKIKVTDAFKQRRQDHFTCKCMGHTAVRQALCLWCFRSERKQALQRSALFICFLKPRAREQLVLTVTDCNLQSEPGQLRHNSASTHWRHISREDFRGPGRVTFIVTGS